MKDLLKMRDETEDERVRLEVNKFLITQLIGNPKQNTDITSSGKVISLVIGDIKGEDDGQDT
jgi:hypothetical protein